MCTMTRRIFTELHQVALTCYAWEKAGEGGKGEGIPVEEKEAKDDEEREPLVEGGVIRGKEWSKETNVPEGANAKKK